MVKEIEYVPLVSFKNAVRGFVAGSLMASGVGLPLGAFLQGVLFIVGLLIMLDSFLPHGSQPYIVTAVITTIIGIIVSFAFILAGLGVGYLVFIIVVAVVLYLDRILSRLRRGPPLTQSDRV